jgi:hypothetical protein
VHKLYSGNVLVALGIQFVMRMRYIVIVASLSQQDIPTYSHKWHDLKKKKSYVV